MKTTMKVITALAALLFISIGVRWAVAPAGVAEEFGMPLLQGMGLSTQIGDLGSFFLCGGLMGLIGIYTERRDWLYAAAMLLTGTAIFRTIAWAAHDAALAVQSISVEVIVTAILLVTAAQFKPAASA